MIEINLIPGERAGGESKVLGINFSLINVKMVLFAVIFLYAIEPVISMLYEDEIKLKEEQRVVSLKKTRALLTELAGYDDVKKQVEKLENQQKILKEKITVVRKIVDKRQNPFAVLKYIADNTPESVWLVSFKLSGRSLTLKGYSQSWKSIGKFIENLKDSIFFSGNVNYKPGTEMKSEIDGIRVENFELQTTIVSFK